VTSRLRLALAARRLPVDALLALSLVVLDLLVSWDASRPGAPDGQWIAPTFLTVGYAALLWRRRFPGWVLAGLVAHSMLAFVVVPGLVPTLGVWLALYTVASLRDRRTAVLGLLAALLPTALNVVDEVNRAPESARVEALITSATLGVMFDLTIFGIGRWVRWSRRMRSLVADLAADQAVFAERQRVAHELHDVVAHSVSLMVLQAGAAAAIVPQDPAGAREAMIRVADLGQLTVVELRRLLGLLDPPTTDAAEERRPGTIATIPALVDRAQSVGATINLVFDGKPRPVEPSVDHSGYRIAQEAITNAMKYGDLTHPINLTVRWSADGVDITAVNRSQARSPGGRTAGRGLIGMRERARAVGGTFTSGWRDAEFEVRVHLPARIEHDADCDQQPEPDRQLEPGTPTHNLHPG